MAKPVRGVSDMFSSLKQCSLVFGAVDGTRDSPRLCRSFQGGCNSEQDATRCSRRAEDFPSRSESPDGDVAPLEDFLGEEVPPPFIASDRSDRRSPGGCSPYISPFPPLWTALAAVAREDFPLLRPDDKVKCLDAVSSHSNLVPRRVRTPLNTSTNTANGNSGGRVLSPEAVSANRKRPLSTRHAQGCSVAVPFRHAPNAPRGVRRTSDPASTRGPLSSKGRKPLLRNGMPLVCRSDSSASHPRRVTGAYNSSDPPRYLTDSSVRGARRRHTPATLPQERVKRKGARRHMNNEVSDGRPRRTDGSVSKERGRTASGNKTAASSVCVHRTSSDNVGTRRASCLLADGSYHPRKPKTRFGGESGRTEETGRDARGEQADLSVSTTSATATPSQRCTAQIQDRRAFKGATPVPSCPFWSFSASTSDTRRLQATGDPPPLADQAVPGSAPNGCDPDTRGGCGSGKTHPLIPRGCIDNQEQDASTRAVPDVATAPGGGFSTGAGVEEARRSRQFPAVRGVRPDGACRKPQPCHISSKNCPSQGSEEFQVSVHTDTESTWEDVEEEARKETARRTSVHEGKAALLRTPTFRYAALPEEARNVGHQSLLTSKEMSSESGLSEAMVCSAAIPGAGDVVKGQATPGKWNGVGALLLRGPRSTGSTRATDHFFMSRFTFVSDFLGFGPSRQVLRRPALAGTSLPPSSSPLCTDSGVASPTSYVAPQVSFCLTTMPSLEGATERKTAPGGTPESKDATSVPSAASLLSHLSRACSVAASSASRLVLSGSLGVQSEWRKTDQNIISENPTGAVSPLNCSSAASDQGVGDDRVGPPIPASGMIALQQELLFLSASASGKQRLSSRRTCPRARRRAAVRDESAETHSGFGRRRADSWHCEYVDSEAKRRSGVSCGTVSAGHSSATGEAPSRDSVIHMPPCTTLSISSCSPGDKGKRYNELASPITWRNAQRSHPLSDAGMDTSSLDSLDSASSSSRGTSNSGDSDTNAETQRQRMPFLPFWPAQVEEDTERSVSCQVIEGRSVDNTRVENEIGRPVVSRCSARANKREVYGHRTDGIQSTRLDARIRDSTGVRVLPTMRSCGCGESLTSPTLNGCKAPPATGLQEENYGAPAFGGGSSRSAVCRQNRRSDDETIAVWLHRKNCLNTRTNERVRATSDGKISTGRVFSLAASGPLEEPKSHCSQLQSDGVKERCVHMSRELSVQGTVYGDDTAKNNSARLGDQNESSVHLAGHRPPKGIKGDSSSGHSISGFLPTQPLSKLPASCGEQQSRGNGPELTDISKVHKPTSVQMWFCSDHFIYDFF